MKTLTEALCACDEISLTPKAEWITVGEAKGRYLTEPLYARHSTPKWNLSAMDGYAIHWAKECNQKIDEISHLTYRVGQIIAAGQPPQDLVEGEVARIMTGAPLPKNADTVILQENVITSSGTHSELGQTIQIQQRPHSVGEHVRKAGEEYIQATQLLDDHRPLNPAALALIASQGIEKLSVWRRPKVAILSTGNELCVAGEALTIGQIYASNGILLRALVEEAGGIAIDCGIAKDTPQETRAGFERALEIQPDLILSTGGVSVGDFDPVKGVLADLGAELHFWKVKMKPGKPLAVGSLAGIPVLALPGNPVSAAVSFLLFAYPLIQRAFGVPLSKAHLQRQTLPLAESMSKDHPRAELLRVECVDFDVNHSPTSKAWRLTGGQSSAWLRPLERADALLLLPEGRISWERGRPTEALRLPWSSAFDPS